MIRINRIVQLPDGQYGKVIDLRRSTNVYHINGQTISQPNLDEVTIKTLSQKTIVLTKYTGLKIFADSEVGASLRQQLNNLNV